VSLLIFGFGILFQGGADGIPMEALNPANAFKDLPANEATGLAAGAAGIGLFFAFWSWVGFEMAPNYGEESKDPKRIVPRAMYISVIGLGIFYTFVSWMSIAGYATFDAAALQAQTDAAGFFLIPAEGLIGGWLREVLSVLIVTGSFACGMAFHNTAARYFYALGREGLIPRVFGKTHPHYHSPHTASALQSVIAALIVVAFAVISGTDDPYTQAYLQLYGLMAAMGVITILFVQSLVSLAIAVYFFRHHEAEVHLWKTIIAPIISIVGQLYVLYLALTNMEFLGAGYAFADWLVWIDLAIFVLGLAYAFYLKSRRVDTYATIGRMIQEGL
jgi:amino acid transporter